MVYMNGLFCVPSYPHDGSGPGRQLTLDGPKTLSKRIHHNTDQPLDTSTAFQLAGAPRLALEMALPTNPTFIHLDDR